ncbi:hypothetical protein [Pontibacter harenae]|uniref:hypothetical protein n=1 Tax=Pontibacter harenae TaxID=2894083 RepID=UPI001E445031|nr:hypothetical protein [Pontibacter harenae]MCC9167903.1 hypothetical protein [Pontibacter harenae]
MKTKLTLLCLLSLASYTKGLCQKANPNHLEVMTVTKDVVAVDMYDPECIHVVDGLITSYTDVVPRQELAHFEQAASEEKLAKLGFTGKQCAMVKSSADLDIENYVYRQVHSQVQQVGTQYKLPIAINGQLTSTYAERRSQLASLKQEQIKKILFLDKAKAQAKYGDKVIFGLIEVTL